MSSKENDLLISAPGILARVIRDVTDDVEGFGRITRSKYFFKRIALEEREGAKPSLALSLVFLQDEENYRENLDEEVAQAIRDSLASQKLTGTVKDVVVNLIHFRDDVRKA